MTDGLEKVLKTLSSPVIHPVFSSDPQAPASAQGHTEAISQVVQFTAKSAGLGQVAGHELGIRAIHGVLHPQDVLMDKALEITRFLSMH